MNPRMRVRVLGAALAAVAAALLAGCAITPQPNTQQPGALDAVVVAPPTDA